MMSDAQLEHRIRLEDIYRNRVIALVSPIVGAGNVTAQVNLDIDFTRGSFLLAPHVLVSIPSAFSHSDLASGYFSATSSAVPRSE